MTQPAPAWDGRVAERLVRLKPVYDDIKAQQAELARLTEAQAARDELDRALAEEQRGLAGAALRKTKLLAEEQELKNRDKVKTPAVVIETRRRVVSSTPAVGAMGLMPGLEAPLPAPAAGEDRVELTNFVRRFLRYSLSTTYPEMLAEFNRIMNAGERPVGEGLALLDWDLAYGQPLGGGERDDPQKWAERLDRWGAELEKYREALVADTGRLRPALETVLPHLDEWRSRSSGDGKWADYVEGEKAAIRAKREPLEKECNEIRDRIAGLRQKQGQP